MLLCLNSDKKVWYSLTPFCVYTRESKLLSSLVNSRKNFYVQNPWIIFGQLLWVYGNQKTRISTQMIIVRYISWLNRKQEIMLLSTDAWEIRYWTMNPVTKRENKMISYNCKNMWKSPYASLYAVSHPAVHPWHLVLVLYSSPCVIQNRTLRTNSQEIFLTTCGLAK